LHSTRIHDSLWYFSICLIYVPVKITKSTSM
jgi:hypothetical protein